MRYENTSNKHLGELLLERGIISRDHLDKALEYQKANQGVLFGEALVKLGFASEEDIVQALTCQYGFPYLPLANYEVDPDVIASVPQDVCTKFCLVPVDKIGKSLTVAMSNPLNVKAVEDIELLTGCAVQTFVSLDTDIRNAIKKYYAGGE